MVVQTHGIYGCIRSRKTFLKMALIVTRSFSEARRQLARGRKVLLNPSADDLNGLEGKFVQVFWSPVHFPNQAGTMGIWCDPSHPALADFPTENHSNWQWWDVCKKAKTLVLDSLDAGIEPIVRMTDNFYKTVIWLWYLRQRLATANC